jgi:hypothetical protein
VRFDGECDYERVRMAHAADSLLIDAECVRPMFGSARRAPPAAVSAGANAIDLLRRLRLQSVAASVLTRHVDALLASASVVVGEKRRTIGVEERALLLHMCAVLHLARALAIAHTLRPVNAGATSGSSTVDAGVPLIAQATRLLAFVGAHVVELEVRSEPRLIGRLISQMRAVCRAARALPALRDKLLPVVTFVLRWTHTLAPLVCGIEMSAMPSLCCCYCAQCADQYHSVWLACCGRCCGRAARRRAHTRRRTRRRLCAGQSGTRGVYGMRAYSIHTYTHRLRSRRHRRTPCDRTRRCSSSV